MKPLPLILLQFVLFAQITVFAQDAELANLLSLKDDTVKVQKLTTFAVKIVHEDMDLSLKASQALLRISQNLNYTKGIANGYSFLAFIDMESGKSASAEQHYEKAIIYYKQAKDERGVAKCLGNMADIYESTGRGPKGMEVRLAAVAILEKLLQDPKASRSSIMHSLAIQYNNFGGTYVNLFYNYDKAQEYLKKAEDICRQNNDTVQLIEVLTNKSAVMTALESNHEALKAGKEVLDLSHATKNNFHLAAGYQSYGYALYKLNRIDSAVLMLRQALKYANKSQSDHRIFKSVHSLAKALAKKGVYDEVIPLLESVYKGTAVDGALKYKSDLEEELANAYFQTGNYKEAYIHLENRFRLEDSVIQMDNNHIIAEKETKYRTAEKEKALAQKELQLQKSRQYAIYGFGSSIVALLLASLIYVQYRNKRRLHQSQLRSFQQEKEIQLLQALMQGEEKERSRIAKDLHDGVAGMLAAVKMHLSSDVDEKVTASHTKAIELLNEATAEVRKTSHNLMPEVLLQHGLDKALQRYCLNISNASLQVYYYFVGEEQRFVASFELSVYRIVQELLNNIFKHSKATEATVQLSMQEGILSVSIEDNGIGISKNPAQSSGMGLESLKRRISALNGNMELSTEDGGGVNAYLEFNTERLLIKRINEEDLALNN